MLKENDYIKINNIIDARLFKAVRSNRIWFEFNACSVGYELFKYDGNTYVYVPHVLNLLFCLQTFRTHYDLLYDVNYT